MKRLLRALALCLLALTLLCASVHAESKTDWEYIEYYYSLFSVNALWTITQGLKKWRETRLYETVPDFV